MSSVRRNVRVAGCERAEGTQGHGRGRELDECSAALLAGVAVVAPFVGAVAAALSISEILRLLHGGRLSRLIDLDLACVEHKIVLPQKRDFGSLNPGFTACK